MTTRTVAATVARLLADAGVDRAFGLPGGEVLVLIDELRRAGVEFVLVRHEANAGFAAAVYGKLRRAPGLALATLGPGAANLMLPLCNATLDHEPLIAISAQIPDDYPPAHTHQLLPLHASYGPVCKYVGSITASTAADVVTRAIAASTTRPQGAAFITLSAREAVRAIDGNAPSGADGTAPRPPYGDAAAHALRMRDLLSRARRPLVMVGLGVDPRHSDLLRRWITGWHLPVAVTPKVKGIVDETHDTFVGVIGGMAADGLMCEILNASDLRIGFGFDPVEVDKTWHAELPIEWMLEIPHVNRGVPDGAELVDHAAFLEAITAIDAPGDWGDPFGEFRRRRSAMLDGRTQSPGCMWLGDIVRALASALPPSTIVTTDVGSHKFLFGQWWPSRLPETFWMSNGLSAMGYGLSAALGARLARPDVPVLAVLGDGGFSMNAQELETAGRVGAPFITLVLEDGSYSLIKLSQERRSLPAYGTDFHRIDTVKMAQACGVDAVRTADPDELARACRGAAAEGRGLVVAVPVDYRDYRPLM